MEALAIFGFLAFLIWISSKRRVPPWHGKFLPDDDEDARRWAEYCGCSHPECPWEHYLGYPLNPFRY